MPKFEPLGLLATFVPIIQMIRPRCDCLRLQIVSKCDPSVSGKVASFGRTLAQKCQKCQKCQILSQDAKRSKAPNFGAFGAIIFPDVGSHCPFLAITHTCRCRLRREIALDLIRVEIPGSARLHVQANISLLAGSSCGQKKYSLSTFRARAKWAQIDYDRS